MRKFIVARSAFKASFKSDDYEKQKKNSGKKRGGQPGHKSLTFEIQFPQKDSVYILLSK